MKLSFAVATLIATTQAVKLTQCDVSCFSSPLPAAYSAAPYCADTALSCASISSPGYGEITAKSKGKSQNAAKANNEYESVQESLKFQGGESQSEKTESEKEACLISKEVVKISGSFEAEQDITEAQAAKVAESGKSATCFRRESKQSLDQLCGQNLPEPLAGGSFSAGSYAAGSVCAADTTGYEGPKPTCPFDCSC